MKLNMQKQQEWKIKIKITENKYVKVKTQPLFEKFLFGVRLQAFSKYMRESSLQTSPFFSTLSSFSIFGTSSSIMSILKIFSTHSFKYERLIEMESCVSEPRWWHLLQLTQLENFMNVCLSELTTLSSRLVLGMPYVGLISSLYARVVPIPFLCFNASFSITSTFFCALGSVAVCLRVQTSLLPLHCTPSPYQDFLYLIVPIHCITFTLFMCYDGKKLFSCTNELECVQHIKDSLFTIHSHGQFSFCTSINVCLVGKNGLPKIMGTLFTSVSQFRMIKSIDFFHWSCFSLVQLL